MSNRRMRISEKGKELLDFITEQLEVDRPEAIKISLAKGIQISNGVIQEDFTSDGKNKWTIPDNIIKEKDFLLFKHLIINEIEQAVDEDLLHDFMCVYIELGLREIYKIYEEKASMEDLKLAIL